MGWFICMTLYFADPCIPVQPVMHKPCTNGYASTLALQHFNCSDAIKTYKKGNPGWKSKIILLCISMAFKVAYRRTFSEDRANREGA